MPWSGDSRINPALGRNHTTTSGGVNPANHTSLSGGNPRVAGRPPAPPTSSGQTGGVGFSCLPSVSRQSAPELIAGQGSVVHGADSPLTSPVVAPAAAGGLLAFIPHGRANATSIPHLRRDTGLSDREVRAEIERLVVEEHIPIVCLPTNPGVFIATTEAEVALGQRQMRSRAMSLLKRARALRMCGEGLRWSPTLFDVSEV